MSNYEIELQVQGSPSGELTQQVDGEPGGGSVSAREAEAWARGTRAGTAVSSDDPTYHNNSKYYAEQAHDAAESASAAYGTNLLAPTFDASQAYPAGAHVIHDGGYYVLPEGHTAGDTWAETSKTQQTVGGEVTGLKSAKADKDGTHEDLTAGNTLFLLSDRGDTDVAPYVFRKTGGAKNGYGREFLRKIVGGTVAWNQLVNKAVFPASGTYSNVTYTNNGDGSITLNGTANGAGLITLVSSASFINTTNGHKLLVDGIQNGDARNGYYIQIKNENDQEVYAIENPTIFTMSGNKIRFNIRFASGTVFNNKKVIVQFFDLTQMFGSTIADAIYAMEQATVGSGVAWFRNLFPNNYYAYDAGSLQSVQAKEKVTRGFNQWDEEWEVGGMYENTINSKNYIRVIPNMKYWFGYTGSEGNVSYYIRLFDENKNGITNYSAERGTYVDKTYEFTMPENAHYMKFRCSGQYGMTYNHDICINISDPAKNGTYEPYVEHTYPLDSSLTLRGIPKWDSTNGLYYDGDEYKPDGTVKRKYGYDDLGSLTWSKTGNNYFAELTQQNVKVSAQTVFNAMCVKFKIASQGHFEEENNSLCYYSTNNGKKIIVYSTDTYANADAFKSAMSGVYLVYELATPTVETADPYHEIQICNRYGTEEFIDAGATATPPTRDVSVPVGTETFYPVDIWHLIDELTALVLEN